jgi:hypothetical protein
MHESGSSVSDGGKGGRFLAGRGTPAQKQASYDVYGSYESEWKALEILCGLIFSRRHCHFNVWGPVFDSDRSKGYRRVVPCTTLLVLLYE